MGKKRSFNEVGVATQRDRFVAQGADWERRAWTVGQGRAVSDQEAAQDIRGNLTPFHSLPSVQPGAEKRSETSVFTHQAPPRGSFPHESMPLAHVACVLPGGSWSLGSPWYVCRSQPLCFGRLETHFSLNG